MPNEHFFDACQNCGQSQNYNYYEQVCYSCGHSEDDFPLKIVGNITIPEMINAANRSAEKWVVEQHSGHLEYFESESVAQNYYNSCVYACYPPRLA